MPYRDIFTNDIYQNEFDETMTRKFPNTYKVIKTIYPDAYKLPEDEIHTMSDILRNQGDTYDEAESLLRKHINQKQSKWNLDYINPKPQTTPAPGLRTSTQAEVDMKRLQNQIKAKAQIQKRLDDYNNKGSNLTDDQRKEVKNEFKNTFYGISKDAFYDYPIVQMGESLGTLYAAKQEMDKINRDGYDNYAHRLGMCLNAQNGYEQAIYSFGLGLLKEAKDITKKTLQGKTLSETLKDSKKDMINNFEGLNYGLNNPNKSCRFWLKDLDYKTNTWK